jgi:hypothetical protein
MLNPDVNRPDTRLLSIAGRWTTSGFVLGDQPVPIAGTDHYEALPGGYFLVHHVDVMVGPTEVRAIEIIGEPDPGGAGYLARSFDNEGHAEVMHVSIDVDGALHFAGGPDVAPTAQPQDAPTAMVRSTLTVAQDRHSMHALWERSDDGSNWQPWMDVNFTRTDTLQGE